MFQVQPYGPNAGDAALAAARKGPLELREVHFSYPLRQNAPGSDPCLLITTVMLASRDMQRRLAHRTDPAALSCLHLCDHAAKKQLEGPAGSFGQNVQSDNCNCMKQPCTAWGQQVQPLEDLELACSSVSGAVSGCSCTPGHFAPVRPGSWWIGQLVQSVGWLVGSAPWLVIGCLVD